MTSVMSGRFVGRIGVAGLLVALAIGLMTIPGRALPPSGACALAEGALCAYANLAGRNLSDADLAEIHLDDAKMNKGTFDNTNFTDAFLLRADLSQSSLVGAKLAGAFLLQADLATTNLSGADLAGARFRMPICPQARSPGPI